MNTLKLGIVGAGGIFRLFHADAWAAHPEIELAAISDPVIENAKALGKQYEIPNVYADYHDMLKRSDIDIIDICAPNVFHSEMAIEALRAGKHVISEKPDAVNPVEAENMAIEAEKSGKTLMVMRNNRFDPANQFMKKYVEDGHMGDIYAARCGWIRRRGIPGKGGWFTTKKMSGGGPLIDLGVHYIDVAIWLMGNPKPVSVSGATYAKLHQSGVSDLSYQTVTENKQGTFDVEDFAGGFIRFDNGATLQLEFSWATNIKEDLRFYDLRGSQSGARFENGQLELFTEISGALCDIQPRIPNTEKTDHARNIEHFVDVVQCRAEPIITPQSGVHMIKILSAIYESAKTGSEIKLT